MYVSAFSIIFLSLFISNDSSVIHWSTGVAEKVPKENTVFVQGNEYDRIQRKDIVEPYEEQLSMVDYLEDSLALSRIEDARLKTRGISIFSKDWWLNKFGRSNASKKSVPGASGNKKGGIFGTGILSRWCGGGEKKQQLKEDPKWTHIRTEPNGKAVVFLPRPEPDSQGFIDYGKVWDSNAGQWTNLKLFVNCKGHS